MENLAIVTLVGVITQVAKNYINTKYIPLLGLVIGGATGLVVVGLDINGLIVGVVSGLVASGAYDNVKQFTK